jgi:Concanavalin A-like lectin/glucanases superfamily
MGYKTSSASRTQAKSTVSSSVSIFNNPDGTGFGISSTSLENKQIKQFSVVSGSSSQSGSSLSGGAGGVSISNLYITDSGYTNIDDTAIGTNGGYIKIVGENFQTGAKIYFNNSAITNTYVSSTQINAVVPSTTVGNYPIYIFNTDGTGAIWSQGLNISGFPSWSQSSYTSTSLTINIQLLATGEGTLAYTLQDGSSLPSGLSLSSSGVLSGTVSQADVYTFIVIVTDAENQGTQQEITLTVSTVDANFKDTILLLSGNGTNNTNNNIFLDNSNNNFTLTRSGNPAQGTFTPFSQTGWSNYFDGTSYALYPTDSQAALTPGASASATYTVEGWYYLTGSHKNYSALWDWRTTGFAQGYYLRITSGGYLQLTDSATVWTDTVNYIDQNTWYHVAFTVVSNGTSTHTYNVYLNGQLIKTGTNSIASTSGRLTIGSNTDRATHTWQGYISNFRVVNGNALYTDNFTPSTTQLTAITNTSLLTCQSNRFIDNSNNNFTITSNGTVSVHSYSPFAPTSQYNATTVGGSGYFDGTTDNLSVPGNTAFEFGSGNFTLEFWMYQLSSSGTQCILDAWNNTPTRFLIRTSGTSLQFYTSPNNTSYTLPTLKTWYHIACVRNGSTFTVYVNGISRATFSSASAITAGTTLWTISRSSEAFNGYLSNIRVVKGTAVYTGNFTPPTSPVLSYGSSSPYSNTSNVNTSFSASSTSLLCNFTNGGIIDSTSKLVFETGGNTVISTTQSKFGNSSIYFDGNDDYLSAPYSPLFNLGSSPFTIEGWVNFDVLSGNRMILDTYTSAGTGGGYQLYWRSTGTSITFYGNGVVIAQSTYTNHATETWYHIAVTRDVWNNLRIFIDGTQYANTSYSTALDIANTSSISIGIQKATLTNDLAGYVDDLRVTKGYARYTANFTPPILEFKVR